MTEIRISNAEFFSLVEQSIGQGQSVTITVKGVSMHPFIRSGRDKVVLTPFSPSELKVGRIVLFKYKGTYIMHRIVSFDGGIFTIQGDGNNIRTTETARAADIVALVSRIIKPSGRIVDCTSPHHLRQFRLWSALNPIRRYIMALDRRIFAGMR